MLNKDRTLSNRKTKEVEQTLKDLELLLKGKNDEVSKGIISNHYNIHILGCARSGTTLLFQLLCKYLDVAYPTNFLSRFSYAPYIGAKIQYLMNDLDNKGELLSDYSEFNLQSNLGKTKGALSPHEFWYYWRSIFDVDELGYIKNVNNETIKKFHIGLDSIKTVFNKPLVLKSMIANSSISKIIDKRPNDIVIYIKRKTEFNAQSLYESRKRFFNDFSKWYSFGIPNRSVDLSPLCEVVEQVIQTNELIELEIEQLNSNNVYRCNYENLANDLPVIINHLKKDKRIKFIKNSIENLNIKNSINLSKDNWNKLMSCVE